MAAALSVPRRIVLSVPGTPYFKDIVDMGDPGNDKQVLMDTVPSDVVRNLQQIVVVCRMEGTFKVMASDQVIASGRTGAAAPNVPFGFFPSRPLDPDTVVTVIFRQRSNCPAVPVEVYLQASDIDA